MATITQAEETVLRSFVGQTPNLADLEEAYGRLKLFDDVVLEELRRQLAVLVSDNTSVITVDGLTINQTENIRALRQQIKDFKAMGGTGLDANSALGVQVSKVYRADYR